jgi:hypothetical protein
MKNDYDRAKRLYEAGKHKLRDISTICSIPLRTLQYQIKQHGWQQFPVEPPEDRDEKMAKGGIVELMANELPLDMQERLLKHRSLGVGLQRDGAKIRKALMNQHRKVVEWISRPDHTIGALMQDAQDRSEETMTASEVYAEGLKLIERSTRALINIAVGVDRAAGIIQRGLAIEREALSLNAIQDLDAAMRRVSAAGYQISDMAVMPPDGGDSYDPVATQAKSMKVAGSIALEDEGED